MYFDNVIISKHCSKLIKKECYLNLFKQKENDLFGVVTRRIVSRLPYMDSYLKILQLVLLFPLWKEIECYYFIVLLHLLIYYNDFFIFAGLCFISFLFQLILIFYK